MGDVGCKPKSEGIVKWGVGQGGCEPRIEVIVKFEEKKLEGVRSGGLMGGGGGVVRSWEEWVDVNEELKLLCKCKKKSGKGGVRGWSGKGVGWR